MVATTDTPDTRTDVDDGPAGARDVGPIYREVLHDTSSERLRVVRDSLGAQLAAAYDDISLLRSCLRAVSHEEARREAAR